MNGGSDGDSESNAFIINIFSRMRQYSGTSSDSFIFTALSISFFAVQLIKLVQLISICSSVRFVSFVPVCHSLGRALYY